jgi:hypothetical protein
LFSSQLEGQTASSHGAIQEYQTKLQEALKEEVALLGVVQQLEEGKAVLEARLSSLEASLSQSVMARPVMCLCSSVNLLVSP